MSERAFTRADRAASALRRVLDLAARILRGLKSLALVAAASVAAAWVAWAFVAPPGDMDEWVVRAIVLAILLAPPAILLLFVAGLRDLGELPERVRALPAEVRTAMHESRRHPGGTPEPSGPLGLAAALFRLGRIVLGSRDLLSPYAAASAALRPAVLLAALAAAAAAIVEVPASLLALLILLST